MISNLYNDSSQSHSQPQQKVILVIYRYQLLLTVMQTFRDAVANVWLEGSDEQRSTVILWAEGEDMQVSVTECDFLQHNKDFWNAL